MKGLLCRCSGAVALMVILSGLLGGRVEAKPPKQLDIADTVAANPILTKFSSMIQASDLTTFLSSRGPFVLFVPTDAAFSRLQPGELDALLQPQNKDRLQHILLFHLVNGKRLYVKDLSTMKQLLSCEGSALTLRTSHSGTQWVMKGKIVHGDIRCLNGVIHEIDTVLSPLETSLPPLLPPPPPAPTNAAPANPTPPVAGDTNTPPADTNAPPVAPVAPAVNTGMNSAPVEAGTNTIPVAPVAAPGTTTP